MKVVAYIRVSTDRQAEEGFGLDAQRRAIEIWAARNNVEVVATYSDEGVSGSEPVEKREALPLALATVDGLELDGIVVYKLDRVARDVIVQELLLQDLARRKIRLFSTFEGEQMLLDDADDPSRTMIRQIIGAVSQYERAMIRLRLASGKKIKKLNGGYVGGTPPYGTYAPGDGTLLPNQAEIAVLEQMLELRAEGMSYDKVAKELNARGHLRRNGSPWIAPRVQEILRKAAPALAEPDEKPAPGGPNRWGSKEKARKRHLLEKKLRELNAS